MYSVKLSLLKPQTLILTLIRIFTHLKLKVVNMAAIVNMNVSRAKRKIKL